MDDAEMHLVARTVALEVGRELVQQLTTLVEASSARFEDCVSGALLGAGVVPIQRAPGVASAVFRREGEYWTLSYDGEITRLRDCRGFRHLARLLSRPNQPVHVLELVGVGERGSIRPSAGLPVLDARAKSEYRRRLADLAEEVTEATERGDLRGAELALEERDFLLAELSRGLGLGGRDRTTGSTSERARLAVTKAIRSAMGTVTEHHRALGDHLDRTVRTGMFCSYSSDPAPAWVC